MIKEKVKDIELSFKSTPELFSPNNLDKGTLAMVSVIDFNKDDIVCDLGCGYGLVGILAAILIKPENIVMVDNEPEAIKSTIENIELNDVQGIKVVLSDVFSEVKETGFTKIISHPPYHVDFSVPKAFIEKGYNRLKIGGQFFMVTKRKDWYKNKLTAIFGGVKIWDIDGYFVFMSVKKKDTYAKVGKKKEKVKTMPQPKKRRR